MTFPWADPLQKFLGAMVKSKRTGRVTIYEKRFPTEESQGTSSPVRAMIELKPQEMLLKLIKNLTRLKGKSAGIEVRRLERCEQVP